MTMLTVGVIVFIAVHLLPSFQTARSTMIDRLGSGPYKGLFSLGALLGLGLMVFGFANTDFVPLWQPPPWARYTSIILMLPALILFAGANMRSNLKRFVHHPLLWGIVLWSVAHLLANGDQASLILFAPLGCFAIFDMWSANRRGATLSTEPVSHKFDVLLIAAGSAAYVAILFLHPYLFGMPVFH